MPSLVFALWVYALASLVELYFFLMQRAALEISRANGIDPKLGRLMLPLWYALVWPTRLLRFGCLYVIWREAGWLNLGAAVAVPLVASTLCPIPFRHFRPMFWKKVTTDLPPESGSHATHLMIALRNVPGNTAKERDG